jgi:hypothetical protein
MNTTQNASIRSILAATALAIVAGSSLPAAAQTPTARPKSQHFWLRVTGDSVNVRSRPDTNSLVMTRVPRGALLAAEELEFGWYRILPPPDTFSYVSAAYIDRRDADRGLVSVRSGKLRVRVGSSVQEVDPIRCEVQALLPRGTPVRILGQHDGWYKILPPPDVRAYISADYVQRVSDEIVAALEPTTAPARPTAAATTTTPPSTQPAITQPAERSDDLPGVWGQRLVAVEADIRSEAHKPLDEQSWDALIARMEPIATQAEEPLTARIAAAWTNKLQRRAAGLKALQAAEEVLRQTERERAQHDREMRRIDQLRTARAETSLYDAQGELGRSFVAGARLEDRWYKLQDPLTDRVVVYLEFDPRTKITPDAYEGKYVGVRGERRFDPKLGADIIRVISVADLESERPRPEPATADS